MPGERQELSRIERPEIKRNAQADLKRGFEKLGIKDWRLPKFKIKFVDGGGTPELGRTEVTDKDVNLVFDARFATKQGEDKIVGELKARGIDYPGMRKTLTHELAHVSMWSVTKLDRQPAIRLLDEGWARLLEDAGCDEAELDEVIRRTKEKVKVGLKEQQVQFERCLNLSSAPTEDEGGELGGAEYEVGEAILLWVREQFGNEKMVELLKKTYSATKRNDAVEPPKVEASVVARARQEERIRFKVALEEITGKKVTVIEKELRDWIGK